MKRFALFSVLLFSTCITHAQLPPQQKVVAEIQRIYNGGVEIFQSWKGGVAQNLGSTEYESMYLFPGTADPRIKQRKGSKPIAYYYEANIAEGKSLNDVKALFKAWKALLGDSTITAISLQDLSPAMPDEKGLVTPTYSVHAGAGKRSSTPAESEVFYVHLDYEQRDDDGLYSVFIQIGYL